MRRNTGIGLTAGLAYGVVVLAQGNNPVTPPTGTPGTRAQLLFTISKETTSITSPLHADGSPDYVAALNEKYGKGVTPANNGFVIWLKIVGTGNGMLPDKTKDQVLKMCGATETPSGTEDFTSYLKAKGITSDAITKAHDDLTAAGLAVWTDAERPIIADFLKTNDAYLTMLTLAAERPRWWMPMVSSDGRSVMFALPPAIGRLRETANALCARATWRGKKGDSNGFLADIVAVKRLARHLGGGPFLIERLVGVSIDRMASQSMGAVVGCGQLTLAQCNAVAAAINQLPPMPSMAEVFDVSERWYMLDIIVLLAEGQLSYKDIIQMTTLIGDNKPQPEATLDSQSVDWDVVLKMFNAQFDDHVRAANIASFTEMRAAMATVEKRLEDMKTDLSGKMESRMPAALRDEFKNNPSATQDQARIQELMIKRQPGETRESYTQYVGQLLMGQFMSSLGRAEVLRRRSEMTELMAKSVLAAATVKARTGKWPASLQEMVPAGLKEVPKDIHSAGAKEGLKYVVKAGGVLVYSVGPDGKEDAGAKDDIAVGVK